MQNNVDKCENVESFTIVINLVTLICKSW
jgi:hypothetical protein